MDPQPNTHGVFEEGQWTEHIQHTTPSGARVGIMLVQRADGWRWGIDYEGQWSGGGGWPSMTDKPLPTRQEAMDAAVALLRCMFGPPYFHDPSPSELRQTADVRAWCDAQKQLELFA